MALVLIAGCGDLGLGLGSNLLSLKHQVIGLRRSPARKSDPFPMQSGDLTSPGNWQAEIPPADWVVFTAAPDKRDEAAYRAVYLEGVKNLSQAFRDKGRLPQKFIFSSSTAVYGQRQGEIVDETSSTVPLSFNGQVLLEAEALVQRLFPDSVIVRFSGIYGPNRRYLLTALKEGRWPKQTNTPYYANRIHRDDCIGLLQHLLLSESPPALIIGTDDEPADVREIKAWIAEISGERKVGPAQENSPESSRREAAASTVSDDFGKRCSNSLLRGVGYQLIYPTYREGYKPLLDS